MSYCVDCGIDHHAEEREAAKSLGEIELAIKRLEVNRDIELARINAGVIRDTAVAEAEAAEEHAEGVEEGLAAAVDAMTPDMPETEEPAPVVIHDGGLPEGEPALDVAPPPVMVADDHDEEPKKAGWWDGYR